VQRVDTDRHVGAWCLYVKDMSGSRGRTNSERFHASPGRYYVEAWVRVDGGFTGSATKGSSPFVEEIAGEGSGRVAGTVVLDVQFVDDNGKHLGGQPVGQASSTQWVRLGPYRMTPRR